MPGDRIGPIRKRALMEQGIVTRRLMPRPPPPPKRSSRTPPREEPAVAQGDGSADGPETGAPARTGTPKRVKRKKKGGRPR